MRKLAIIPIFIALLIAIPAYGQGEQTSPEQTEQGVALLAPELFENGRAAFQAGNYDRAVLDFSIFILLNPTFSEGYYVRALSYAGLENAERALADIERAIATAPETPEYQAALYALRGGIHAFEGQLEDAIVDYTEALDRSPSGELYARRGTAYAGMQDLDNALLDFNSAIELEADNPGLYSGRASINNELGNTEAAASDYHEYVDLLETRRVENDPLVSGEPQYVTMSEGTVHQFELEGEQDQVISIVAQGRPGDPVDPLLVMLDPTGEALIASDDYGDTYDAGILNFPLPVTGIYTILLSYAFGGANGQVAIGYEVAK
jgi:tetratricopeptide (TPR) repeat protein